MSSFNLTAATLEGPVRRAVAIQITVFNLCLVFDLQCYDLTGYHGLKPRDDGVFLQRIDEDPWQAGRRRNKQN